MEKKHERQLNNGTRFGMMQLLEDDHIEGAIMGFDKEGNQYGIRMGNDKDQALDAARIVFLAQDVEFYITVAEAWAVARRKETTASDIAADLEELTKVKPSESPDRYEVLVIGMISRDEKVTRHIKFRRDSKGHVIEFSPIEEFTDTQGAFADLLPDENTPEFVKQAARRAIKKLEQSMVQSGGKCDCNTCSKDNDDDEEQQGGGSWTSERHG